MAQAPTSYAPNGQFRLIDVPVSNNGARVRWVMAKKGISNIKIEPPAFLGGLKSPEYLRLNPQGKMPLLLLPNGGALPESEVIVQYLLDKYSGIGPSLQAATPEARAVGALVTRLVDLYITPIQACMYRKMECAEERARDIATIATQLDAIEHTIKDTAAPFVCGHQMTTADAALFPTMVFCQFMLPKFFGWPDVLAGRPTLAAWWAAVQEDKEASKIINEILNALNGWDANNRWRDQGIIQQVAENKHLKWAF